ncbi:MAG: hypothetical protein ACRD0U_09905 [Acidimicrobiales bacterium]
MNIVAFAPDLMDQSRIRSALGETVTFVRRATDLAGATADVVLVDLSRPGALDAAATVGARTIGFGPHVDAALLEQARAAGCDEVLPRSRFFPRLAALAE